LKRARATHPQSPPPDRRLLASAPPARRWLRLAIGAGFLAAVLLALQAWLLSGVIAAVFLAQAGLSEVGGALLGLCLLVLARAGAIWLGDDLAQRAAGQLKRDTRSALMARLVALGPAFTHRERSGELVNTAVEGVETLDEYVTLYLPARSLAVLVPLLILAVVFVIDPWTTLVLLFAGPMLILLLGLIGSRAGEISARRFVELGWLSAFFLDLLQGLPTLKLFGRSREQAATIEDISRHYGDTTMQVLATAFQTSLVMEWAATAATAMVALEVSLRLMSGALPYHQALALLLLTPEFFLPLRQLALRYHAGTAGKAAAERITALLDTPLAAPSSLSSSLSPSRLRLSSPPFDLHFHDVSYSYPPRNRGAHPSAASYRPAISDVTFTVPAGCTVALVGPTGAGKSTLASLLLRFLEPDAGHISAGAVSLADTDPAAWRRHVAWVPQQPHLFHGSVADNLRLARADATAAEIEAAARAAQAHAFITALPQGYDSPLGEGGARLSGGERQRLAIARAFLKDAPVLVLDEATANLDAASEALILSALTDLRRGRTVLVIAHRLRLAQSADQVIVLDGGCVVARGDPATLLAAGGLYARLVASYDGED
jgi:ATP-binding cassette subfamily C protein CydD